MGNKLAKQEEQDVIMVKASPPLDPAFVKWLTKDVSSVYGYAPTSQRAIRPPEHYIEYMRLQGWLDLNLDDPDLARLRKQ